MGNRDASSGKSGAGGSAKSSEMSYKDVKFEGSEIEAGKPTRYSQEVFNSNYREARQLAASENGEFSFSSLYSNDSDPVMKAPTLKGVQSLINSEKKNIGRSVDLGVITPQQATTRMRALSAVQKTLNKTVRSSRDIVPGLRKKK